jgi:hypothetical protein
MRGALALGVPVRGGAAARARRDRLARQSDRDLLSFAARRALAGSAALAAIVLHASFCEWRTIEVEAEGAAEPEARAIWLVRRVAHETGNAPQFEARKLELRAYHSEWLACWATEAEAPSAAPIACRKRLALKSDATTRAVAVALCEQETGVALSARESFRSCLAARGYSEVRSPRWTRDDFGPRFAGPYVVLTGLFAEHTRASGVWLGLVAPLACLAGGLWIVRGQSSTCAPSSTTRFGGTRK